MLAVAAAAAALAFSPCTVQSVSARCGTVVVPENRARQKGKSIALNVVVIPAVRKPAAPDAFVYLVGGPGDAATNAASGAVGMWPGVHQTRDILLVDQRGTGQSNPLACPVPTKPIRG